MMLVNQIVDRNSVSIRNLPKNNVEGLQWAAAKLNGIPLGDLISLGMAIGAKL